MGNNDQLGLDFDVEQTEWGKWVDPDRRSAQVRKFLDYAGFQHIPSKPWPGRLAGRKTNRLPCRGTVSGYGDRNEARECG